MFSTLDILVFLGSLTAVMAIGLVAARRESTSEDFFLAGRQVGWWGVAGSVFGSNISANHLVGMLGIGYSIGFAQSHFELGAIAALMLLAYAFLPVYRKLGVYTLSEYLELRFDNRSRTLYAIILIVVTLVQLTAALYIGSRSLGLLLAETPLAPSYLHGVVVLALVTATYTIFGGLKAVIYTDVLQSMLLLAAGIAVAAFTFAQPEIGGWSGMMAADRALGVADQKMHLYLPPNHPDLPWTGALSGLLILHCFYWSTNQAIVQRALAARSDAQARAGIITAGFLKLLVPFFAIGGGVAAAQLFSARLPDQLIQPDAAMPELIKLVIPAGFGLMGLIMAGLIGAILSSIDSMVNSAATLIAFDLYKRHLRPAANDRQLLVLGRWVIALLIGVSTVLALVTFDPDGSGNFFLRVSSQASYFTPGLVVAFATGMFWCGATRQGALAAIVSGPPFAFAFEAFYNVVLGPLPAVAAMAGDRLNFLHRVFLTMIFCGSVLALVSRLSQVDPDKVRFTFAQLSTGDDAQTRRVLSQVATLGASLLALGGAVHAGWIGVAIAAPLGALVATLPFLPFIRRDRVTGRGGLVGSDKSWAALLCAATVFLMFWFF